MKYFIYKIAGTCLLMLSVFSLWAQAGQLLTTVILPDDVYSIQAEGDTTTYKIVQDCRLYTENWDTLAQPIFWRKIMSMGKDSSLVNIASSRKILFYVATSRIDSMTKDDIKDFKDSIRTARGMDEEVKIYITSGKRFYYPLKTALPLINQSIPIFVQQHIDPWYAQAILLIESPGRARTSHVGAKGSFQLMKRVAIAQGLKVNSTIDERDDPKKAAEGAASLLRTVCIPRAKMILNEHKVAYSEQDIWFRLMVLHVYHAGYRNVRAVFKEINPKEGNMALIQTLWQTESRAFGNASQNYSQLILASFLRLDEIVFNEFEIQCNCCGE